MPNWLKSTLQYSLSLLLGASLLWYVFKGADFSSIFKHIEQADFSWVFLSYVFAIASHLVRAYRWNLLMESVNIKPSIRSSFFAIMVGYLANIVLPRLGEVTRCAILQKTDNVPMNKSFGTVITERLIDLICLITITLFTLVIEFERLSGFVYSLFTEKFSGSTSTYLIIALAFLLFLAAAGIYFTLFIFRSPSITSPFLIKVRTFLKGLLEGFLSFKNLKKKKEFLVATLLIWIGYFFMSYVVFYSLPSTSSLGLSAGMAVLVLGGLGMAAPVQGGIGAFHWIIQHGLVLYGLSLTEGLTYATLVHSSQMLMMIVVGLVSLVLALLFTKQKNRIAVSSSIG